MYHKYGQYDSSSDLKECYALIKKYKESQVEYSSFTSNKQYPLPFNAYKLDEDKSHVQFWILLKFLKFKLIFIYSKNKTNETSIPVLETNSNENDLLKIEKEKKDIVDKLFG